jgi:hypothetical protein
VSDNSEKIEELMGRLAELEARVQELEDEREIRELLSRYGYTADTCKDEAFVELYTEDGAMKLSMPNAPSDDPIVVWEGRDRVREFITNPAGHHSARLYGKSMHVNDNMVTHVEGDEAVANSYQFAIAVDENGVRLLSAGNNQWQLRKIDGQWHIKERRGAYLGDAFFTANMDATPT